MYQPQRCLLFLTSLQVQLTAFPYRITDTGTGTYFEWLEWTGHITMRATSGVALHDLKFRGERIAYELSLQELFIAYNGYGGGYCVMTRSEL